MTNPLDSRGTSPGANRLGPFVCAVPIKWLRTAGLRFPQRTDGLPSSSPVLQAGGRSYRAMTNPQFSFNFTLASRLQRSCFLLLVQVDWDD